MTTAVQFSSVSMSENEARHYVELIKDGIASAERTIITVRRYIDELYRLEGWKALGYPSWRQCVETEFQKGRSTLYQQLAAATVEHQISATGGIGIIPERVLRPLTKKKFSEETRRTLWTIAVEVAGSESSVTSTLMNSVIDTLGEAIVTGTLSNEDGEQSPIWERLKVDALARTIETRQRQQEHISGTRKILSGISASAKIDPHKHVSIELHEHLTPDQLNRLEHNNGLRVTVWIE